MDGPRSLRLRRGHRRANALTGSLTRVRYRFRKGVFRWSIESHARYAATSLDAYRVSTVLTIYQDVLLAVATLRPKDSFRNASRSVLTSFARVVHIPWGAPG